MRVALFVRPEMRAAELARVVRVSDVEDHGAAVPVGHERERPLAVRDHRVDEGRAHVADPVARAGLRPPRADPDRVARVAHVVDAQAREVALLGIWDCGGDVGVTADRLEPELVRTPWLRADERELARPRWVRDVVEPEAVERSLAGTGLVARRGKRAAESGRRDVLDDRFLGPAAGERGVVRGVAIGRDTGRVK